MVVDIMCQSPQTAATATLCNYFPADFIHTAEGLRPSIAIKITETNEQTAINLLGDLENEGQHYLRLHRNVLQRRWLKDPLARRLFRRSA